MDKIPFEELKRRMTPSRPVKNKRPSIKVYLAEYCPDIMESEFRVISVHYTLEGAKKAIREHKKATAYKDRFMNWAVREIYVKD